MSDKIIIHIEVGDNLKDVLRDYVNRFMGVYDNPVDIGAGIAQILAKAIESSKTKGKTWRLGNG